MNWLRSLSAYRQFISHNNFLHFLQTCFLVPSQFYCSSSTCGPDKETAYECSIQSVGKFKTPTWRCSNRRDCGRRYNIRRRTVFQGFNCISSFMEVLVVWILRYPPRIICSEVGLCPRVVRDIIRRCQFVVGLWLESGGMGSQKIGGPGLTVEVDESTMGKSKKTRNHKARQGKTYWVVGGICRETKQRFFVHKPVRDKANLRAAICEYVEPGSLVQTDCWKGYDLTGLPYIHRKINHRRAFVDPANRANHSQNIENTWGVLKKDMRRRLGRVTKEAFESVRLEMMWRSRCHNHLELFTSFCAAAGSIYR